MFQYLEKLRTKGDHIKKRIAFTVAFVFALVMFLLWLTIFLPQFEKDQDAQARHDASSGAESPVSNFIDIVSAGINQIQKNYSEAREKISSMSTTTSYYSAGNIGTSTQNLGN